MAKRRTFTPGVKAQVVLETLAGATHRALHVTAPLESATSIGSSPGFLRGGKHPRTRLMRQQVATVGKGIAILSGLLVLLGLFLSSLHSYLLFHNLAEIFSIVIACAIFMFAWNARHFLQNNYLLFIGIAYLFVAGVDLIHTLAYKGMRVFPGDDANLPTQLWIAARYLQGISLFIAPLLLRRKLNPYYVFIGYAVAVGLLLGAIFYWHVFPDCYIEGLGLTPFKKISEYIISLILLASVASLLKSRAGFDRGVLNLLILSIVFTIGAELAFTLYVSVYGLLNIIGHLLKIVAFYLIYKAIIETGLVRPYDLLFRDLKQSEETLQQYAFELQARNEELDAFAHTVAHDLKNPLAIIISSANGLEHYHATLEDEQRQELLELIGRTGFKMNKIIDNLLLLGQVRKVEVQAEPLDMGAVVAEARQGLVQLIEEHQAEIILPDAWPVAWGYGPWVEEVWANYLSNGIKYGGQSPRVELGATAQADGMIRFWVRDNGPGLTRDEQARLFKSFTQRKQVRVSGHGFGLSIVRRIVEKLGGQVGVEGKVGQGSVFYFTLPGAPGRSIN
jgi:signal transduction histidine kinase